MTYNLKDSLSVFLLQFFVGTSETTKNGKMKFPIFWGLSYVCLEIDNFMKHPYAVRITT